MEAIKLPQVTIDHPKGKIIVTHKTGMRTEVSESKLEQWALGLLRKELTQKAVK